MLEYIFILLDDILTRMKLFFWRKTAKNEVFEILALNTSMILLKVFLPEILSDVILDGEFKNEVIFIRRLLVVEIFLNFDFVMAFDSKF